MTMHSEAAPQSVHSSCCTNGTARLPLGNPSFLSAGKPSAMFLLVAMGGESLRAMAVGGGLDGSPDGRWWNRRNRSVGEVFLHHGQERGEERFRYDLDLGLGVHSVVVAIAVVAALEDALGQS